MTSHDNDKVPIYTIGYGAREIEAFVAVLQRYEIAYVLDVRSRPYSRYKPDFSQDALAEHLRQAGIRYVYMGDALGGQPDDPACYTDGKVDYDKVQSAAFYGQGLERLQEAWRQQLRVALMCSEGKPESCHRTKLIGRSLVDLDIPVAHIDEHDGLITQADALLRVIGGQPSLFGDAFYQLTSRKRYRTDSGEELSDDGDGR